MKVGKISLTATLIILTLSLALGAVLAYTINYNKSTQVQEQVVIGNTVKTVDGLLVGLKSKESGNLTYYALDETETDKHTLTYTYDYTIVNGVYDIVVTSLSNDVVIVNYNVTDVIEIEIALDQDKDFVKDQVLNIIFLFELKDITLAGFSPNNQLNINNATQQELESIGLTTVYATRTISSASVMTFTSLEQWANEIQAPSIRELLQRYVDAGVIIFE